MARFKVPAIVVAVLVLALALGFRLEHPASGFKTALGSPSSSVVITKKADTYSVGDKVVVKSASDELSPLLGQVTAITGEQYSVTNGVFLETISSENVKGKMIVVLPFLGYLLEIVGL
jgi:LysM repeat protein